MDAGVPKVSPRVHGSTGQLVPVEMTHVFPCFCEIWKESLFSGTNVSRVKTVSGLVLPV